MMHHYVFTVILQENVSARIIRCLTNVINAPMTVIVLLMVVSHVIVQRMALFKKEQIVQLQGNVIVRRM